jgi:hypothetical protein
MTSRRNHTHDVKQAACQAAQLVQRQTCEGCQHLRALRPMCMSEASPHWRAPRATYQDCCTAYTVKGRQQPAPAPIVTSVPRPPETKRKRSYVTGDVSRRLS